MVYCFMLKGDENSLKLIPFEFSKVIEKFYIIHDGYK